MVEIARGIIMVNFNFFKFFVFFKFVNISIFLLVVTTSIFAANTSENNITTENTSFKSSSLINNKNNENNENAGIQLTKLAQKPYQQLSDDQKQLLKKVAGEWGLTAEEYSKYLYYINYTPDATTYDKKTTNPLWILASHTQDKNLYNQYLKKAVEIEYNEVGRMLKVSQDFSVLAHEMHPNEYPVMAPWIITNRLQSGDIVQIFCDVKDQTSSNVLDVVLPRIRDVSGARLDIFAVGKTTTKDIESFGIKNQIKKNEVNSKKITLNFGNKAFGLLESGAHKKLPLPFVVVRRDGKEIPVNLGGGHV
jgi:integrating conjugative element protein (TIGR03759 family)